ncbi:MAG: hypothetical protein GY868_10015 [Deltaproteobacteria bacterium]|nr:hypothetical protein [Deltaproteobacteria bacterium]
MSYYTHRYKRQIKQLIVFLGACLIGFVLLQLLDSDMFPKSTGSNSLIKNRIKNMPSKEKRKIWDNLSDQQKKAVKRKLGKRP